MLKKTNYLVCTETLSICLGTIKKYLCYGKEIPPAFYICCCCLLSFHLPLFWFKSVIRRWIRAVFNNFNSNSPDSALIRQARWRSNDSYVNWSSSPPIQELCFPGLDARAIVRLDLNTSYAAILLLPIYGCETHRSIIGLTFTNSIFYYWQRIHAQVSSSNEFQQPNLSANKYLRTWPSE